MTAGEIARRRREELGWGQREVARRANVTHPSVSRFERNLGSTLETVQSIFRALDLPMRLLDEEDTDGGRGPGGMRLTSENGPVLIR